MAGTQIKWDEAASAAENARCELPPLVEAWFELGRTLAAGEDSPKEFHAFRLRTKRLRYTLELFRPFYGPRLEKCMASLREVQARLGELNDCAATRAIAEAALPVRSPQRVRIERFLDSRVAALTAAFRKTWSEIDKTGEDVRWRAYLGRNWKSIAVRRRPPA
jgi:CHAD domain-containing protein